ncbi:MAG: hypothetical protein JWO56_948 [Acidobacteria bacterium]|nr:hypothetical protein [Acidobacteriota bacterium]
MPAAVAFGLATPIIAAALSALGLLPVAALLVAAILAAAVAGAARKRLAELFRLSAERPGAVALFGAVALLAAVRLWAMAFFMMDSAHAELSVLWFDPFYIRHNCFSASFLAAKLAMEHAANPYLSELYDTDLYRNFLGRFTMDEFLYPSPFLLLPRLGLVFTKSFLTLRAMWFAIEAATFAAGLAVVAKWVGGDEGRRALLLTPALWLSTPVLLTLQIGNFQLAGIAMAMMAMVAFERGRRATGGALLGFALFKIFPGIVLVVLAMQRRWRDIAWTIGFSIAYTAASVAWMGTTPLLQFFRYGLPRIMHGDAWAFMELQIPIIHQVVAINQSIPGLALKLHQFGVPLDMRDGVQKMSLVYSILVLGLAVLAGLRMEAADRLTRAQLWIALIALAALRSPFVPDTYALPPVLWLWSLTLPKLWYRRAALTAGLLLWVPLSTVLPFEGPLGTEGHLRLFLGLTIQVIAVAFTGATFVQRARAAALDLAQEPV